MAFHIPSNHCQWL